MKSKNCKRLNRDSERIPRRLSKQSGDPATGVGVKQRSRASGLASELKIDIHPYGAAQHCRYRQNIPRSLSERSGDPVHRGRGEGSNVLENAGGVVKNRCKWSVAEFASELVFLGRLYFNH